MKIVGKNFLKAFLFVCSGLVLTTIVFAGVRAAIGPPTEPGSPEATNITASGCKLSFLAPRNDGGAPIYNYLIEYRTWGWGAWIKKGTTQSSVREYTVHNMTEGSEASFRVFANNEYGMSPPSLPSDYITFKDPFKPGKDQ